MVTERTEKSGTKSKFPSFDKIAFLLLSFPKNMVEKILTRFNETERHLITQRMLLLKPLDGVLLENLCGEFIQDVENLMNSQKHPEDSKTILRHFFHSLEKAENKMVVQEAQISGFSETLRNIHASSLTNFLKHEHPQTIALVLSRIDAQKAALVLSELPETLVVDVINRMLSMGPVQQEVLNEIEDTLKTELQNVSLVGLDSLGHLADIFDAFDFKTEERFMQNLESKNSDVARQLRERILTIEDLKYIDRDGIKKILSGIDKSKLVVALKGASDTLKEIFFETMPERSAALLKEDITALERVKVRDVYEAQREIVSKTKELLKKGEIYLNKSLMNKTIGTIDKNLE